jgi:uncharacterized protein YjbI with pentapeptide repeats
MLGAKQRIDVSGPRESYWKGILTDGVLRRHWNWHRRGHTGEGRIMMVDKNLSGTAVAGLQGARFERCDLSYASVVNAEKIELIDCDLEGGNAWRYLEDSQLVRCRLVECNLSNASLDRASIDGGDWSRARLARTFWESAQVQGVVLRDADLHGANFKDARFIDCDFRGADLSFESVPDLDTGGYGGATGAQFVRCDFRGARLDGLPVSGTAFHQCAFHGLQGAPVVRGPIDIQDADLSPNRDGSAIGGPDALLSSWQERG